MTRGWTVVLWRRTALGTLANWFGPQTVSLDHHTHRLGFARHAREAYEQLPSSSKRKLKAYSRGLNAALQSKSVRTQDPFVVLDKTPEPWKPWHSLAVERLLAWVATDPASLQSVNAEAATDFRRSNRRLRRWLHLHGWDRSVAWAARAPEDTSRTLLFARHVLGSSAQPLLQEITLHRPDAPPLRGGSLPGVPLFPTATTGSRAWSLLLSSPARLERVPLDTSRLSQWHERITPIGDDEQLVQVRRHGDALLLDTTASPSRPSPPSDTTAPDTTLPSTSSPSSSTAAPPDTALVLQWPGLSTHSDLPAWMELLDLSTSSADSPSDTASFRLFRNEGLEVHPSGAWQVRGRPPIVVRDPTKGTVLVGRSPWARHQAKSLQVHQRTSPPDGARWSVSDSSTWAADLLPDLLPDVAPLSETPPYGEALSYLRNWDYNYEASSIGAAIFDHWMQAYRTEIGHLPTAPDTTYLAAPRRLQTFRRAVDTLTVRYGSDVRRWRWERVAPDRRFFPMWAADSLVTPDLDGLSTTRYAPLDRPGHGHASTLAGGPNLVHAPPLGPAPSQWEGWIPSDQSALTVRRLRFDPTEFFARPLMSEERPSPVFLLQTEVSNTTTLLPSQP